MSPSKSSLARSLGVSRQSLYYHPTRPGKDEHLRDQILSAIEEHPSYGYRRLSLYFKQEKELVVNKKRIQRVMQSFHIRPKILRGRKRWITTKSDGMITASAPNLIKYLCPIQPDVVWVGDFTELTFHGKKIFLATIMDAYTREIIAWQIGFHHTTRLIIDVLEEAKRKRVSCPRYFHSDQGSEYTAHECLRWLVHHGIRVSMSPKGKPWNNGKQESWYLTFKSECGTPQKLPSIEALIEVIGKFINYYNTRRIQSKIKMIPRRFYEKMKWNYTKIS